MLRPMIEHPVECDDLMRVRDGHCGGIDHATIGELEPRIQRPVIEAIVVPDHCRAEIAEMALPVLNGIEPTGQQVDLATSPDADMMVVDRLQTFQNVIDLCL